MDKDQLMDKLSILVEESPEPIFVAIMTQEHAITYGNDLMKNLPTKEKQSIAFCLTHTILDTFAEFK